jgi:Methyltransferase domain
VTEQPAIAAALRRSLLDMLPKNSVGAEIGVHMGDFSAVILTTLEPARLHLIDPWHYEASPTYEGAWYGGQAEGGQEEMDARYESVVARFADEIRSGAVVVHRGESAAVLETIPDDYFDWVYIDGNHLYEYVRQDLEWSLRKTKVGGLVTGDDYREGGWWDGGVKKAVDEFVASGAARLAHCNHGQYVFERSAASPG